MFERAKETLKKSWTKTKEWVKSNPAKACLLAGGTLIGGVTGIKVGKRKGYKKGERDGFAKGLKEGDYQNWLEFCENYDVDPEWEGVKATRIAGKHDSLKNVLEAAKKAGFDEDTEVTGYLFVDSTVEEKKQD